MKIKINKIIIIFVIFSIYNEFKFIHIPLSELSLLLSLFIIIIFLGILVSISNKENIEYIINDTRETQIQVEKNEKWHFRDK